MSGAENYLPPMDLRRATPDDLAVLLEWVPDEAACRLWGGPSMRFPMTIDTLRGDIATDDRTSHVLVDEGGEPVAFGQLVHSAPTRRRLARLIVMPERRGEGVGVWLCYRLIERASSEHEVATVSLNVYRVNTRARRLYEAIGFEVAGADRPEMLHMQAPVQRALRRARQKLATRR